MASSFIPVSNTKNGFTIVTQVVSGPPGKTGSNISTPGPVQRLLKGEPKVLGTVQIMIGITTLLFGIVSTVTMFTVSVVSGVTLWGPLFYITSGALSVAAGNKENPCLVKASLTLNVISSVVAGIAIIVMSVSISLASGVSGVLLVFSLLEFIISICSSAFACKASCCPEITVSPFHNSEAGNEDEEN
ncbi:membrane-spanning 4-domains subfamily A member 4A-like [Hoplias malabaricus]|uniref:membrane-spanning 4-domains subfamily A member 4A-like n=1 Tax=Hoplias malabaricus TaxID=27720 RepID=UPI00346198BA